LATSFLNFCGRDSSKADLIPDAGRNNKGARNTDVVDIARPGRLNPLPAAGTESALEDAAQQWINILDDMVNNKKTVQQAVDDVNKNDKIQQFAVYGNHSVKITTAPVSP
jgi:ABC-type glycerol-3-phosphate transport system substrate-binding protein